MTEIVPRLLDMLEQRGWKGRIVRVERLVDLKEAIDDRYARGLLDEALYREQLGALSFDLPEELPEARSIIVVAVPVPQVRIVLRWKGERRAVVVPPTYVAYSATTARVQAILAAWIEQAGYRAAKPSLPLKTLAVGSGLAEYGRNNICYVRGMGSFIQLVASFSDLPCTHDTWREPRALERCESCVACLQRCPTGAIPRDRFLLHAERCLTYHNEGADDLPAWVDPSWHHCLVGCMRCQSVCPENKTVLGWFDDRAEFSEQETALLVERVPLELLPSETATKLQGLEINEDYQILCRNLSLLVGQATSVT